MPTRLHIPFATKPSLNPKLPKIPRQRSHCPADICRGSRTSHPLQNDQLSTHARIPSVAATNQSQKTPCAWTALIRLGRRDGWGRGRGVDCGGAGPSIQAVDWLLAFCDALLCAPVASAPSSHWRLFPANESGQARPKRRVAEESRRVLNFSQRPLRPPILQSTAGRHG